MPGTKVFPKNDNDNIEKFIRQEFKKRECKRYEVEDAEKLTCHCGYSKLTHTADACHGRSRGYRRHPSSPNTPWTLLDDTRTSETDAYGILDFGDPGQILTRDQQNTKRFVRVDYATDPETLLELFADYWKMNEPELILSVISNSKWEDEYQKALREKETTVGGTGEPPAQGRSSQKANGVVQNIGREMNGAEGSNSQSNNGEDITKKDETQGLKPETTDEINTKEEKKRKRSHSRRKHTEESQREAEKGGQNAEILANEGQNAKKSQDNKKEGQNAEKSEEIEKEGQNAKKSQDSKKEGQNAEKSEEIEKEGQNAHEKGKETKDKIENIDDVKQKRTNICRSIVRVAASANAWIITGGQGEKGEVDDIIGKEVRRIWDQEEKRPKAVLGICNWGSLKDKQSFVKKDKRPEYTSEEKGIFLNEDHTHFILVDDGTQNKPGCEKLLRQEIEMRLLQPFNRRKRTGSSDSLTPFVYILIGGGQRELDIVERALAAKIPVIIVRDTGGAADQLAHIVEKDLPGKTNDITRMITQFVYAAEAEEAEISKGIDGLMKRELNATQKTNEITQLIVGMAEPLRGEKFKIHPSMNDLIRNRKGFVFVLNAELDGTHGVGEQILKALLEVNRNNCLKLFLLIADWSYDKFFETLLQQDPLGCELEEVMFEILFRNHPKYVNLLLDNGVKLTDFVHNRCIEIKEKTKPNIPSLKELTTEECLKDLLGGLMKDNYVFCIYNPSVDSSQENIRVTGKNKKVGADPAKVLFVCCVLRGMTDMAMIFWREGKDLLTMALIGYLISKRLRKIDERCEESAKMETQMNFFAKLAVDFLKICYADNRRNTRNILVGFASNFGDLTPMEVALYANFSSFVAQPSCQDLLEEIWRKHIVDHSKFGYIPLIVSTFLVLPAPMLLTIRREKKTKNATKEASEPQSAMRTLKEYVRDLGSFLTTPMIKFAYSFISYIGFLILFSIVMLTDFRPKISIAEGFLIAWIFALIIDEIGQLITDHASVEGYLRNDWNNFDLASIITYVIGFIIRVIYHSSPDICPECLYAARLLISLSLIIFYVRVLQAFYVNKFLGPKVYMMRRLFKDLLGFLFILAVFVMAYGVASNVVMYPNQPLSRDLLVDVIYDAWWSVIQQFDRDESLGDNCVENSVRQVSKDYCSSSRIPDVRYLDCKADQCPANYWFVPILMFVYAIIIVVMMLNILIAMFNVTFSKINAKADQVCKMQRYRIIREFSNRRPLPPPLSAVYLIEYFVRCIQCCHDNCVSDAENSDDEDGKTTTRSSKDSTRDKSSRWRRTKPERRKGGPFGKEIDKHCYIWERKMRERYDEESRQKDITFVATNPDKSETDDLDRPEKVRLVLRSTEKPSAMEESIKTLIKEMKEIKQLVQGNKHRNEEDDDASDRKTLTPGDMLMQRITGIDESQN